MGIIRFLLAISVVIAHSKAIFGINIVGGQIAVQSFFIISGFYMSLILNEKYINKNKSFKLFITNRLLRLYPLYWAVLILTIIFSTIVLFNFESPNEGRFLAYSMYSKNLSFGTIAFLAFTNVFIFFQDVILFLGVDLQSGNLFFTDSFLNTSPKLYTFLLIPQGWTVGLELMFYLIAPLLVRKKLKIIIPLIILSVTIRILLFNMGYKDDPWTYRFFPSELVFFLLGNISYRILKFIQKQTIDKLYSYILLTIILIFTIFYDKVDFSYKMYIYFTLFFIALPFIFELTKKWKKDIIIGELSYPIYISHFLVIYIIRTIELKTYGHSGLVIVFFTIAISTLLNELIAKKVEKYRQNRITK